MMLFITKNYSIPAVLSTSFGIIIAIRLTAYYNEDLSKDVAKMLPFALLGLVLVDPSYFGLGAEPHITIVESFMAIPDLVIQGIQFIIFIILLEWVLRILLTIRYNRTIKFYEELVWLQLVWVISKRVQDLRLTVTLSK